MNYLAHLYLVENTPESLVGALLGDFVKGNAKNNYSPVIQRNIELHRRIDSFTDAHPIVRASKAVFAPERRRFAGVLLDIFFDHYLATHWEQFSQIPLDVFATNVYGALHAHHGILPEKLQRMLPFMRSENWLGSYARVEWIDLTLQRMAKRLHRGAALASGVIELQQNYDQFEREFWLFFPALQQFVQSHRP